MPLLSSLSLHRWHWACPLAAGTLLAVGPVLATPLPQPSLRCQASTPGQPAPSPWQDCHAALTGPQLQLEAEANQVLLWTLDGGTHANRIQLFGPDGHLLRQWPAVHNGRQEIGWITASAGRYTLQVDNPYFSAQSAVDEEPPRWQLRASGPAMPDIDARPPQAQAGAPSSPLLLQIKEQINKATKEQQGILMEKFWQDTRVRGTPLLEPLPHPQEMLTTFLWRAPAGTSEQPHQVRLDWAMRSSDPFQLQRLPGTDIWYLSLPLPRGLRAAYQLVVNPPRYPAAAGQAVDRFTRAQTQQLAAQRDALNPHAWHAGNPGLPEGPAARHAQRSVIDTAAGAGLHNQPPDLLWPPLAGSLQHLRFQSQLLGNTRSLSLYLPPGPHAHARLPLLVLFDREAYLERVQLPQRLERWVAEGQIRPLAVLLVGNPTRDDRAKELPPHSPAFGQMLATELLPWLRAREPALAREAAQVTVAGSSYGGLAAAYLGWSHPETFGKVLSLSGSFWWAPAQPGADRPSRWSEGDWFMQQVARSPKRAVQWHLGYGLMERGTQGGSGLLDNNRHLRNVLQAKGYQVSTDELAAGHDYYAWGDALLRGLQALQQPVQP